MSNVKILSFEQIQNTNKFFKDTLEDKQANYRHQLKQVAQNDEYQQLKADSLYYLNKAKQESSEEMYDLYKRFNKLAENDGDKTGNGRNNMVTSFYGIDYPASQLATPTTTRRNSLNSLSNESVRGPPLTINDLNSVLPTKNSNSNTNEILDSAESLIRRLDIKQTKPNAESKRNGAPAIDLNELKSSIASSLLRRSNGRRRTSNASSIPQLESPSSSAISNASSVLANVAEQQLPQRGRPSKNQGLTESEVRTLVNRETDVVESDANIAARIAENDTGSGFKRKKAKKLTKKKRNSLM